ncbi:MAG: ATP-binding protein [Clostridia bacterium]|nr:ATP-binding protein [Clostridia bacterium]
MKEQVFSASIDCLQDVLSLIERELEAVDCPMRTTIQISVAAEEIFANIARYAYPESGGTAVIRIEADEHETVIRFTDAGIPFNPLEKPDPDISLPVEQREAGGLGIYMVKKTMDEVTYQRDGLNNILTIVKRY